MKRLFLLNPWCSALFWGSSGGVLMYVLSCLPLGVTWRNELLMILGLVFILSAFFYTVRIPEHPRGFLLVFLPGLLTWVLLFSVPHIILAAQHAGEYSFSWITAFLQMLTTGALFILGLTWLSLRLRRTGRSG